MALVLLKCPNCGGELQLDNSREFGFCQFCGSKVLIQANQNSNPVVSQPVININIPAATTQPVAQQPIPQQFNSMIDCEFFRTNGLNQPLFKFVVLFDGLEVATLGAGKSKTIKTVAGEHMLTVKSRGIEDLTTTIKLFSNTKLILGIKGFVTQKITVKAEQL